jgi:EAL domain-containing protein (putative c-di-GMP-specific phosphodiesterase class I)
LLARCNFSVIKLDRQLTSQLAASTPAPHWLAALSSLLRNTGLKVVAEGVETDYQATVLHAAGVQMAQGFFFSRSLSAPELIAYHASAS